MGHSKSDQRKYRTKEEEEDMKKNHDAIDKFKNDLIAMNMITEEEFDELDKKIEKEIDDAADKAKKVDEIISVKEAMSYVYAE